MKTPSEGNVAFAYRSDVGRVRSRNEDALAVGDDGVWAVLADGMGGYCGGDVAASIGVSVFRDCLDVAGLQHTGVEEVAELLARATEDAHFAILREGQVHPELLGMGSTVVAVVFLRGQLVCAHLGDSRLYRLRADAFDQLTVDHTMVQELVDSGQVAADEVRHSVYRGMLTRGLGVTVAEQPELGVHRVEPGDVYLLCSDGLTDMVDDEDIARAMAAEEDVGVIAERLVTLANSQGGRDNVSVIVARVRA